MPSPLAIAWCVLAGFFLLLAPALPALWDRVSGDRSSLGHVAAMESVRIGVSAVGLLLLMVGSWDLATALVARWTR